MKTKNCTLCGEEKERFVDGPKLEIADLAPVETFVCQECVDYCVESFGLKKLTNDQAARKSLRESTWRKSVQAPKAELSLMPEKEDLLGCTFCGKPTAEDTKLVHACDFYTYKKEGKKYLERVVQHKMFIEAYRDLEPHRVMSVNICDHCIRLADG